MARPDQAIAATLSRILLIIYPKRERNAGARTAVSRKQGERMSHSITLRKTDPGNHPETIRLYQTCPANISLRRMICQGRGRKRADSLGSSICMTALSYIVGKLFDKPVELRSRIMDRSTSAKVGSSVTSPHRSQTSHYRPFSRLALFMSTPKSPNPRANQG
jgi:hypothetical protein